jgi:uncharacterized protein YecT (DUF1311 family)
MLAKLTDRVRTGRLAFLLLTLLFAGLATAAPYPNLTGARKDPSSRAAWYQQCQQVRYQRAPLDDMPRSRAPAHCDASARYYDTLAIDKPSDEDWQKVRECAFRNNDNAVLMMLYANGAGVAPNLGLAMKYACSTESSPAEMKSRLAHLTRRTAHESFDQCDDVTGGARMAMCAGVRERQGEKLRNTELASFVRRWTQKEQLGFDMARQAARYFAQHRRDFETDQGGPAHSRLQADVAAAEYERFASDIEDFEKGKVPRFTEGEFTTLDERMNQVYQDFMQAAPGPNSYLGTIRKAGVEKTQRAWLAYRDTMELFGSIKYPGVPASGWRALLTSRRLQQLSELNDAAIGK